MERERESMIIFGFLWVLKFSSVNSDFVSGSDITFYFVALKD